LFIQSKWLRWWGPHATVCYSFNIPKWNGFRNWWWKSQKIHGCISLLYIIKHL
jgi:hypothetical protein